MANSSLYGDSVTKNDESIWRFTNIVMKQVILWKLGLLLQYHIIDIVFVGSGNHFYSFANLHGREEMMKLNKFSFAKMKPESTENVEQSLKISKERCQCFTFTILAPKPGTGRVLVSRRLPGKEAKQIAWVFMSIIVTRCDGPLLGDEQIHLLIPVSGSL